MEIGKGTGPVDKDGKPLIRKLGTIDVDVYSPTLAENSIINFKGKTYSMRWHFDADRAYSANLHALGNYSYFQFQNYETGEKLLPFGYGRAYGRSFVKDDSVYVSCTYGLRPEEMTKVFMLSSADMVHWKMREILDHPGWFIFTSPMCKAGNHYVMMHDIYSAPSEGRKNVVCCRFSVSEDMVHWKTTPSECWYGRPNNFAAGHYIDYLDGYYYNFFMANDTVNHGWSMNVTLSKDLIHWEDSPLNPVLRASADDYKLAHQNFSDKQKERISQLNETNNINNSDMCLFEYKGKLIIHYFTGNQSLNAPCTLAKAVYDGSKAQFLQGWFPKSNEIKNGESE